MLSSPPRRRCEPADVVLHLENKYNTRLIYNGDRIKPASLEFKSRISRSDGSFYSAKNQWFVKLPKDALADLKDIIIWSQWTPYGWIIPAERILRYFQTNKISATNDDHWDPRIAINSKGEGKLWTCFAEHEPLDITDCHVDFTQDHSSFLEEDESISLAPRVAELNRNFRFPKDAEDAEHLQLRAERDQRNAALGYKGELLVAEMERRRLQAAGMGVAADNVRLVASEKGSDALGYDVLSTSSGEKRRLIEVKTTRAGARTPFYISANELAVAEKNPSTWSLIRIFDYGVKPGFFEISSSVKSHADLRAISFLAKPIMTGLEIQRLVLR